MNSLSIKLLALAAIAAVGVGGSVAAAPPAQGLQPGDKGPSFQQVRYTYQQCVQDAVVACAALHPTDLYARMQCISERRDACEGLPGTP